MINWKKSGNGQWPEITETESADQIQSVNQSLKKYPSVKLNENILKPKCIVTRLKTGLFAQLKKSLSLGDAWFSDNSN